jgi:hypothetical protein
MFFLPESLIITIFEYTIPYHYELLPMINESHIHIHECSANSNGFDMLSNHPNKTNNISSSYKRNTKKSIHKKCIKTSYNKRRLVRVVKEINLKSIEVCRTGSNPVVVVYFSSILLVNI